VRRRVLAIVALAGLWLATTGGRVRGDQIALLEAEEARLRHLERRVAAALKDEFPELTATKDRAVMRATLERLLARAGHGDPARRAAMLLAAHFLAVRLEPVDAPSNEELDRSRDPDLERVEVVAGHRRRYRWAALGARWLYDWDLMRTVWQSHPATPWGEAAFVELLGRGGRDNPFCHAGPDDFREVIREGEQFLVQAPRSGIRREVVLYLAWAYETWWSLSRSTDDEYVDDPRVYAPGADDAWRNAVARYREALLLGLSGVMARDARARLAKLRQRVDTSQRIFHCIYD
jgi:hypothetical protein